MAFRDAPRVVQAFLLFAAMATIVQVLLVLDVARTLRDVITPFTGWIAAMPYMFGAAVWPAFYRRGDPASVRQARRSMTAQCALLVVAAIFGVFELVRFYHLHNAENPLLRYSPLRPLWTVALPLAWGLALWKQRSRLSR